MIAFLIAALLLQSPGMPAARRRQPSLDSRLEGRWEATIQDSGKPVRLLLRVAPRERAPIALTIGNGAPIRSGGFGYSPDGRFFGKFNDIDLRGVLRPSDAAFDAEFERGGTISKAVFRRLPRDPGARPQTPHGPFPYDSYNLSIDTGSGVLAATLTMPKGPGPFPAAVLLSGTGPDTRDGTFAGHHPFWVLADHLTRRGIAVLRYDDRGAGQSSGLFGELRTVDADAIDAIAAVRFLEEEAGIDRARIGLIGFSEGGAVAPAAARAGANAAFMVLLCAPAMDGVSLTLLQKERIAKALGASGAKADADAALNRRIVEVLTTATEHAAARAAIRDAFLEWERARGDGAGVLSRFDALLELQLARITSPAFRQRLMFDPIPALRDVRVPTLAIFGSLDVQVPSAENAPPMRAAIEGSSPISDVLVLDGLNHALQTAPTGSVAEYATIAETISPRVLEAVSVWIRRAIAK